MIRKIITVVVFLWCLSGMMFAKAQAIQSDPSRESLTNFNANITVGTDGMANVIENIAYDMDGVEHHGLERFMPVSFKLDSGKYINYDFQLSSVSQDGQSVRSNLTRNGSWWNIRIGDPNYTTQGLHNYTISYKYGPVIERTKDGNLFYFNVFGNYWILPAKKVTASISMPKAAPILQTACFTGSSGSAQHDCLATIKGQKVELFATRQFAPREGMSIKILMKPGKFSNYIQLADQPITGNVGRSTSQISTIQIYFNGMLLFFFFGLFISGMSQFVRENVTKKRQVIIPQYEPPDKLSPAELGLLIDKRLATGEIVATLVHLATRGYLRIRETKPKGWFRKATYEVDLIKSPTGLKNYELVILGLIFEPDQLVASKLPVTAPIKRSNSVESSAAVRSITEDLEDNMRTKSFYVSEGVFSAKKIKLIGVISGLMLIGLIVISIAATKSLKLLQYAPFILGFAGSLFVIKQKYTQLGYGEWAKVKGFEWFLTVTEKDRMKFENAPAKTPALFNELLPYAIALGVEKKWAKQFEAINLGQSNSWYVGSAAGYTALTLTNDLTGSFSSVVGSNVVPSASGGGFGGGGAGGGGGGGGGGGW